MDGLAVTVVGKTGLNLNTCEKNEWDIRAVLRMGTKLETRIGRGEPHGLDTHPYFQH